MTPERVVWILGAGFSKFLGGPLLQDFFSAPLHQRVLAATGNEKLRTSFSNLRTYYRADQLVDGIRQGTWKYPWSNAEEFSELLETAAYAREEARNRARSLLLPFVVDPGPPEASWSDFSYWTRICKKYIAASCSEFVDSPAAAEILERWAPYRLWAAGIEPTDAIVSFNYDCVVEHAFKGVKRAFFRASPKDEGLPEGSSLGPIVLKLHGSVDWALAGDSFHEDVQAIEDSERDVLIATPGPAKVDMVSSHFERLWQLAESVLIGADVIVLVGYRFPESDVEAKRRILGAISKNLCVKLAIRVVLGPERDHDDVRRLKGLLEWALRLRNSADDVFDTDIEIEPMKAQDFLTVFSREGLIDVSHDRPPWERRFRTPAPPLLTGKPRYARSAVGAS